MLWFWRCVRGLVDIVRSMLSVRPVEPSEDINGVHVGRCVFSRSAYSGVGFCRTDAQDSPFTPATSDLAVDRPHSRRRIRRSADARLEPGCACLLDAEAIKKWGPNCDRSRPDSTTDSRRTDIEYGDQNRRSSRLLTPTLDSETEYLPMVGEPAHRRQRLVRPGEPFWSSAAADLSLAPITGGRRTVRAQSQHSRSFTRHVVPHRPR